MTKCIKCGIITNVRQGNNPFKEGCEVVEDMTNQQFDAFIESIAKLIEKSETLEQAAKTVRDLKSSNKKEL